MTPPSERTTGTDALPETDAIHAFRMLHPAVQRWIWNQNWESLRPVQAKAIPPIMGTVDDILITAQTAGGKTEAALLPMVSRILLERGAGLGFNLLYISPLKALINDQTNRIEAICKDIHVPVQPWHGDVSQSEKQRARDRPQGILLITPESLEAFMVHRYTSLKRLFGKLMGVIIDEYHALLDNERGMQTLSLISRLEEVTGRPIRRIALSATIGDLQQAARQLQPDPNRTVRIVEPETTTLRSTGDAPSLEITFRTAIQSGQRRRGDASADSRITADLYRELRGSNALVFADSRQAVEAYAERLRAKCDTEGVPNEFFPHHGSLSSEHRAELETRLKGGQPATAICTSTLELGIDIGDIATVAQIRAPYSVASLRQRLGRSGRRDSPAKLRLYILESNPQKRSHPTDWLHLELIRGMAMLRLLLDGWCEPAETGKLHLSTLTHQILSTIAARHGVSAAGLYHSLCSRGPFRHVNPDLFGSLLRQLASNEQNLIEQDPARNLLILGRKGERLLQGRDFYAAFKSTENYQLITAHQNLGTLPVACPLTTDKPIIFSGQNWLITAIDEERRIVQVEPHESGDLPRFSGTPGDIHETVIRQMYHELESDLEADYLDHEGVAALRQARKVYEYLNLENDPILEYKSGHHLIASGLGSRANLSLKILLETRGWKTYCWNGFLEAEAGDNRKSIRASLADIAATPEPDPAATLAEYKALLIEKYHEQLGDELLAVDLASSKLAFGTAATAAGELIQPGGENYQRPSKATAR